MKISLIEEPPTRRWDEIGRDRGRGHNQFPEKFRVERLSNHFAERQDSRISLPSPRRTELLEETNKNSSSTIFSLLLRLLR